MSSNDPVSLMKEGKKLATKSFFKWKADYDGAATCYEKAANLFKMQRKTDNAILAYRMAGDAHHRATNFYNSAKALEMVGNIMRDDKRKVSDVALAYKKAAETFQEDGKPERAGEVLSKAIKTMEREYASTSNGGKSGGSSIDFTSDESLRAEIIDMYHLAIDVYDDKYHLSGDMMRSFNNFLVKAGNYADCIENIEKQIVGFESLKQPHNIWKCYLSVVILHLKMGDWPAADDAHQSFLSKHSQYMHTDEGNLAQQLLDSFEQHNEDLLQQALKSNKFKFLDTQICKLARTLTMGTMKHDATRQGKPRRETDAKRSELFGAASDGEQEEGEGDEGAEETQGEPAVQQAGKEPSPGHEDQQEDHEDRIYDPNDFT